MRVALNAHRWDSDEARERWAHAFETHVPPALVESGPVKEEIHVGEGLLEHGGLREFPIPFTTNGWGFGKFMATADASFPTLAAGSAITIADSTGTTVLAGSFQQLPGGGG